ncbi:MAG TPA: site-2 protease family protein [Solirubrobacterales bacterium]|nr:site-2 protease family protein [Solirubrobacterales bacterium]
MSWFAVFLGFCFLIVVHEAGHFAAAKAVGMRVERFFLFFGPTIWSFKRGETEYGVKAIPLGGYVKITGMNPEEDVPPEHEENAYFRKPIWKRIVVVAAGPAVNLVLAFVILVGVFGIGGLEKTNQSVGAIKSGSPASRVLKEGDRIVAVDGKRFPDLALEQRLKAFGNVVKAHRCAGRQVNDCRAATPVKLTISRDGALKTISVYPRYDKEEGRALIGFSYGGHFVPISFGHAVSKSLDSVWLVTSKTATIFARIFESEQRKQISGIVGTSDVGHAAVEQGWRQALLLLALVSLSLGLINLLPILPLDGGHILWAVVEKLRGEPVSLRVIERATVVGFALVLMLMFIGLSNDIGRITGEGFEVR